MAFYSASLIKDNYIDAIITNFLLIITVYVLTGCQSNPATSSESRNAVNDSVYYYHPLNPTTIWSRDYSQIEMENDKTLHNAGDEPLKFKKALLKDLDSETVRISTETLSGNAGFNAGIISSSIEGNSYVLFVDYIKYFTSARLIKIKYTSNTEQGKIEEKEFERTVPVYTGVGLRIRADFIALKSDVDISGLPALALAANVKNITGRLTVQTLGITGKEITSLLPVISDISITSIQSAVQAIAAIKSKIYDDTTELSPKLIGFESPGKSPDLISKITEDLYTSSVYICPTISDGLKNGAEDVYWINWGCGPPE